MDPEDFYLAESALTRLLDDRLVASGPSERERVRQAEKLAARKKVPQDGDVVVNSDGTVYRVGDQPRSRRRPASSTKEVARTMSAMEQTQEQFKSLLVKLAGMQAVLDRFGGKQPPKGTVVRWIKRYDNQRAEMILDADSRLNAGGAVRFTVQAPQEYVFLAFRAPDGAWYSTSQRGSAKRDWDTLLQEIDDAECQIVAGEDAWLEVPAPAKVVDEAMDPGAWARMMFGKKDEGVAETTSTTES